MIDGMELPKQYGLKLPIMVMMGDMPFLNKLVCFQGGLLETSQACRLCNIVLDHCDNPYEPYKVTNSHLLLERLSNNPYSMKNIGYYPVKNNIFHQLEFCHSCGVNASTPVEPLHCVLLGLFIRLLQGFNWLRREDMQIPESSSREAHFIFTGVYKDAVQSYLKCIVFILHQQSDPDMPCTFSPSGYLPNVHDEDDKEDGSWNEGSFAGYFDFYVVRKAQKFIAMKGWTWNTCKLHAFIWIDNTVGLSVGWIMIVFQGKNYK